MTLAHARTRPTKLVVVAGFFWLLILFVFTLSDYWTRDTFLGVLGGVGGGASGLSRSGKVIREIDVHALR